MSSPFPVRGRPWPYQLKRIAVGPRTAWRRRRHRGDDEVTRQLLEAQYYRPAVYHYLHDAADDPDITSTFDLSDDAPLVDGGAYTGEWAAAVAQRYESTVHAFEPIEGLARKAAEADAGGGTILVSPNGLAGEDRNATMGFAGPGSVVVADDAEPASDQQSVSLRDVAAVLDEIAGPDGRVAVMKLNIEGGEYEVLERMIATDWLPRVDCLLVQFHEWHPGSYRRRRAIRRALAKTHSEDFNYPWIWERWSRDQASTGRIRP